MSQREKVIVVGGGVAGLTAAHELAKRKFDVTVYERRADRLGGKASSVRLAARLPGQPGLPGEHGFRFFPAWYKHVPATMRDIPFRARGDCLPDRNVEDHLVACDDDVMLRYEGAPVRLVLRPPRSQAQVRSAIEFARALQRMDLPASEAAFFLQTLATFLRTPEPERSRAYDARSWWQLIDAEHRTPAFRDLAVSATQTLLAARAKQASAYTIATMAVRMLFDSPVGRDRVLDGPTSEVWIDPWVEHLESRRGVKFVRGRELESISFSVREKKIESITVSSSEEALKRRALRYVAQGRTLPLSGRRLSLPDEPVAARDDYRDLPIAPAAERDTADYYVFALPVEQMAYYVNRSSMMTDYDGTLRNVVRLAGSVEWMAGVQFYLRAPIGFNRGHVVCADSEWALTAIEQALFWRDVPLPDGVRSVLSVDVSNWNAPGRFTRKEAYRCNANEIADEVWRQLQASFNRQGGDRVLYDSLLVGGKLDRGKSFHLDDDIVEIFDRRKQAAYFRSQAVRLSADELLHQTLPDEAAFAFGERLAVNVEPLLVNRPGSLALRPAAATGIRNMFLAADYVTTWTNLACMEGANEAARRAVNAILDASGATADPCELWNFEEGNVVAQALGWVGSLDGLPGVTQSMSLASSALGFARAALEGVKQSVDQWRRR